MLTYQLQARTIRLSTEEKPIFPNDLLIEMILEPGTPFGIDDGPSKTGVKDQHVRINWNANVGRGYISCAPIINPPHVIMKYENMQMEMKENRLVTKTYCNNLSEVHEIIRTIYFSIPSLLNLEFIDSPTIKQITGSIGKCQFSWEFQEGDLLFDLTDTESQELKIKNTFEKLSTVCMEENRRLAAAIHYFFMACRLSIAGKSPWEFMAETVLNYCKTLQVLFGEDRDDVRKGLHSLGCSTDEIENVFIPIMLLRNEFDIGHASISILEQSELDTIYQYLFFLENAFRNMLVDLFSKIMDGTYNLKQEKDLALSFKKRKVMNDILSHIGNSSTKQIKSKNYRAEFRTKGTKQ